VIAWPSLIHLDNDRGVRLDDATTESVLEQAADAGALFTPGRPRPDPVALLLQHLRDAGVTPAKPPR